MLTRRATLSAAAFSDFGTLLRVLRRRARLSQRELGLAVGYSEAQISRLEQARRRPDPTVIAGACSRLRCGWAASRSWLRGCTSWRCCPGPPAALTDLDIGFYRKPTDPAAAAAGPVAESGRARATITTAARAADLAALPPAAQPSR